MEPEDPDKLRSRAERFGVPEPKELKVISRPLRPLRSTFKAGIEIHSQEELAKRRTRAERFKVEENILNYKPLGQAEEEQRKTRAKRFGTPYQAVDRSGLDAEDILEERQDQNTAVERRPNTVYLFGVDKLSTKDVSEYFIDFAPQSVEWINDSSCNVCFGDDNSARMAIASGQPLPPATSELQDLDASDIQSLPYLWHKGPDFVKRGAGKIPLIFRMATVLDRKGLAPKQPPRNLWLSGTHKKQQAASRKRRAQVDADGDMTMAEAGQNGHARGPRKRLKRRRGLMAKQSGPQADLQEVEMQADEEKEQLPEVDMAVHEDVPSEQRKMNDEEFEAARAKQRAEGPSGLFSAERAGLLPSFLLTDEQSPTAAT